MFTLNGYDCGSVALTLGCAFSARARKRINVRQGNLSFNATLSASKEGVHLRDQGWGRNPRSGG